MQTTNCKRKGAIVVAKDGKKEQAEPEKEDMKMKEVKENESGMADSNMMEENEVGERAKETAERKKSPKEKNYKAKIELKKGNKPVKDRKIKSGTEKRNNTLEFAKFGIKRKIEQLEESAAEVSTKRTNNEKADESKGKNMIFHKFF